MFHSSIYLFLLGIQSQIHEENFKRAVTFRLLFNCSRRAILLIVKMPFSSKRQLIVASSPRTSSSVHVSVINYQRHVGQLYIVLKFEPEYKAKEYALDASSHFLNNMSSEKCIVDTYHTLLIQSPFCWCNQNLSGWSQPHW